MTKNSGWMQPELVEDTVLDQVTLELNIVSKMKEVLSNKDFEKVEPLIEYLEKNSQIATKTAELLLNKFNATAWRYLQILENAQVIKSDGSTNNSVYVRVK